MNYSQIIYLKAYRLSYAILKKANYDVKNAYKIALEHYKKTGTAIADYSIDQIMVLAEKRGLTIANPFEVSIN